MLGSFSRRLEWLERVSRDPGMRGLPTAVAVQLARYINSTSGRAWPGIATLAKALTADRRSVQRALDLLVEAGHLERALGGGAGRTNSYWMRKGGADAAPNDAKRRRPRPERAASTPGKGRRRRRPNTGKEHGEEHGEGARRTRELPHDWELGAAEFAVAQQCAGWDPERAREEFEHFRAHHRTKGTRSRDWGASWEIWCRNGAKFDSRSQRGSSRGALRGLQRWLARQDSDDSEPE